MGLADARFRARYEQTAGVFVAEGHLAVQRLVASPYSLRSLWVATTRAQHFAPLMAQVAAMGAEVLTADTSVMAEVTGFEPHRGILAIGVRAPGRRADEVLAAPGLVVAAEGLNDGENMGALGRCAAAFGAAGLLLDPTCCDPLTRRSVRVSLGHILAVPLARVAPWPDGMGNAGIEDAGVEVVALTPQDSAVPLHDYAASIVASPPRTLVVVVGSEGAGLSPAMLAQATQRVKIPMAAGVDSLNAATAVAVALSHLMAAYPLPDTGVPGPGP